MAPNRVLEQIDLAVERAVDEVNDKLNFSCEILGRPRITQVGGIGFSSGVRT